jgi:hypothetical protein
LGNEVTGGDPFANEPIGDKGGPSFGRIAGRQKPAIRLITILTDFIVRRD